MKPRAAKAPEVSQVRRQIQKDLGTWGDYAPVPWPTHVINITPSGREMILAAVPGKLLGLLVLARTDHLVARATLGA